MRFPSGPSGPLAPSSCLALQPLAALQCVVTGPPLKLPSLFRKEKREPHACFALLAHNGMNYFQKHYSCLFVFTRYFFCFLFCCMFISWNDSLGWIKVRMLQHKSFQPIAFLYCLTKQTTTEWIPSSIFEQTLSILSYTFWPMTFYSKDWLTLNFLNYKHQITSVSERQRGLGSGWSWRLK